MITADSRQKSVTLELTTANKQLLLTTATADKQLKPISAAVVPLREGPADDGKRWYSEGRYMICGSFKWEEGLGGGGRNIDFGLGAGGVFPRAIQF